ncbi:MAG: TetR/AcrR family transcriptional regulator [Acidimicrobiia bacterium]
MTEIVEARKPGRPRSTECDEQILRAAMEEYAENGFDGMSVDAVAARAGVSKATIYRRYPSKLELVAASIFGLAEAAAPKPDTGSLRGDLQASLHNLSQLVADPVLGQCIRTMVPDGIRNPELGQVHEHFVRHRRAGTIAALERAIARGELRAGLDVELAADVIAGPLFYRHLVSHMPIDDDYVDGVIDVFVAAYGS